MLFLTLLHVTIFNVTSRDYCHIYSEIALCMLLERYLILLSRYFFFSFWISIIFLHLFFAGRGTDSLVSLLDHDSDSKNNLCDRKNILKINEDFYIFFKCIIGTSDKNGRLLLQIDVYTSHAM